MGQTPSLPTSDAELPRESRDPASFSRGALSRGPGALERTLTETAFDGLRRPRRSAVRPRERSQFLFLILWRQIPDHSR